MARARLGRAIRTTGAAAFGLAVLAGAWILYNTVLLNRFRTERGWEDLRARYERLYKVHEDEPQPKITEMQLDVAFFPRQLSVRLKGTYTLVNKTAQDINFVHVNLPTSAQVHELALGVGAETVLLDEELGFRSLKLLQPLRPGATTSLRFDVEHGHRGFENEPKQLEIVENGSFINEGLFPRLGYSERNELAEDSKRRKRGLPPKRMLPADDPKGAQINFTGREADLIRFEATLSTEPDQLAIAPGYLQREWTDGGRHYFDYRMDAPILDILSFQSGRYTVERDSWNGILIEVYYHPPHNFNVKRMIEAVKDSLEYYTREFGAYQHRQVRIIEYPQYARYAISLPNTIPYSEAVGFIAHPDPTNEKDVDYPYYVTAHEVAHQWWGHQVIPAYVRGASFVSETLAQYSSLMVMKRKYGDRRMKRFLLHELNTYLLGRTRESKQELPLVDVENQPYIHYNKGSLAMYALQDYIGEDKVNSALRNFLQATRLKGPPYATSPQLFAEFQKVTPEDLQYLLEDLFRNITLFENRARSATARLLPDGKYEVTIKASAKKIHAGGLGEQKEVPLADWIDFGALDRAGNALALEGRKVTTRDMEVKLIVDKLPAKAGIDPLNKLVDRNPTDNCVRVQTQSLLPLGEG